MTPGRRVQPISDPSPSTKPRNCLWSHRALGCHMSLLGYMFPLCSGLEGTTGHLPPLTQARPQGSWLPMELYTSHGHSISLLKSQFF